MTIEDILSGLISFPTVVGTPNGAKVEWIREYCQATGAAASAYPRPEGARSNLFATIGPRTRRGHVLSSHMDVVRVGEPEWSSDLFAMRRNGSRRYGRGTADVNGFIACAFATLPQFAAMRLQWLIHLAFSYDEEAGARGVPHPIKALSSLCESPLEAIIGEPSRMQAVRGHKGNATVRLEVIGRSGKSSRPDLGLNANHAMAGVVMQVAAYAQSLTNGPLDHDFAPPTLPFRLSSSGAVSR